MLELYEIPPHIKPNWQVWYECVLPEDRQHAEKVIRDSLQSRSPFKLEISHCRERWHPPYPRPRQPGTE